MQASCVTNLAFRKTGYVYDSKEDFDFSLGDILGNLPRKKTHKMLQYVKEYGKLRICASVFHDRH